MADMEWLSDGYLKSNYNYWLEWMAEMKWAMAVLWDVNTYYWSEQIITKYGRVKNGGVQ